MNKWTSAYYISHETKLHYYRTDRQKPPLVLIHGITDDGLCWLPVARELTADHDVIMVDLRGHGKSDAPDKGYNYKTMANEVAGLITGLGLGKPAVMGHSLGAMTTLTIASLFPDLPRSIILEDPPAVWHSGPPSQEHLDLRAGMRSWFHDVKRKTHSELIEIVRAENPNWPETELGPWVDSKHRFSLNITKMLDSRESDPLNSTTLFRKITCPVLLITADPEQGAIVTSEEAAQLKKYVPQLQRDHISGAGHSIRREQFEKYMESVKAFLNQTLS